MTKNKGQTKYKNMKKKIEEKWIKEISEKNFKPMDNKPIYGRYNLRQKELKVANVKKKEKMEYKGAEEFVKRLEKNIALSPYNDLTKIGEGVYKTKNVGSATARDANNLFNAIFRGDLKTIKEIAPKYEKAFLTAKKAGQTRERFIQVNTAQVRIYNLANKALKDMSQLTN